MSKASGYWFGLTSFSASSAFVVSPGSGQHELLFAARYDHDRRGEQNSPQASDGCPDEGVWMTVVEFEVVGDGVLQFAGAAMDAAAQSFLGETSEPTFHQVEPGSARRREVEMLGADDAAANA
jgi:hypothetical protein